MACRPDAFMGHGGLKSGRLACEGFFNAGYKWCRLQAKATNHIGING